MRNNTQTLPVVNTKIVRKPLPYYVVIHFPTGIRKAWHGLTRCQSLRWAAKISTDYPGIDVRVVFTGNSKNEVRAIFRKGVLAESLVNA